MDYIQNSINQSFDKLYESTIGLCGDFLIKKDHRDDFDKINVLVFGMFDRGLKHMRGVDDLEDIVNWCTDLYYDLFTEFCRKYDVLLSKEGVIYERGRKNEG